MTKTQKALNFFLNISLMAALIFTDLGAATPVKASGSGITVQKQAAAVRMDTPIVYTQISASAQHTCGLKSDGKIVCWGDNSFNQTAVRDGSYTLVSAGKRNTCAVEAITEQIFCWGENAYGSHMSRQATTLRSALGIFIPVD